MVFEMIGDADELVKWHREKWRPGTVRGGSLRSVHTNPPPAPLGAIMSSEDMVGESQFKRLTTMLSSFREKLQRSGELRPLASLLSHSASLTMLSSVYRAKPS